MESGVRGRKRCDRGSLIVTVEKEEEDTLTAD